MLWYCTRSCLGSCVEVGYGQYTMNEAKGKLERRQKTSRSVGCLVYVGNSVSVCVCLGSCCRLRKSPSLATINLGMTALAVRARGRVILWGTGHPPKTP